MVNPSIRVWNVMGGAFVAMGSRNISVGDVVGSAIMGSESMPVRNVVGRAFVAMVNRNIRVWNVMGRAFVPMGSKKVVARNMAVEGCARRNIIQPEKTESTKDTVFFALYICFLPSAWQGIIGRRRPLW